MNKKHFTINSRKYDGGLHRSWNCELISKSDTLYILRGIFDKEINHPEIGIIGRGTLSIEYFWLDQWFNIFRFESGEGKFLGFYCNIIMPPVISGNILEFVDLDLDIFVDANFELKILDEAEFTLNSAHFRYPQDLIKKSYKTLKEVQEMVEKGEFPFNKIS